MIAQIITVFIVTAYGDVSAAQKCLVAQGGPYPYMERLTPSKVMCSMTKTDKAVSTYVVAGIKN